MTTVYTAWDHLDSQSRAGIPRTPEVLEYLRMLQLEAMQQGAYAALNHVASLRDLGAGIKEQAFAAVAKWDTQTVQGWEPLPSAALIPPEPAPTAWHDGIHKEGSETYYYTQERRYVLRTTNEKPIGWRPLWVFESMRPTSATP